MVDRQSFILTVLPSPKAYSQPKCFASVCCHCLRHIGIMITFMVCDRLAKLRDYNDMENARIENSLFSHPPLRLLPGVFSLRARRLTLTFELLSFSEKI